MLDCSIVYDRNVEITRVLFGGEKHLVLHDRNAASNLYHDRFNHSLGGHRGSLVKPRDSTAGSKLGPLSKKRQQSIMREQATIHSQRCVPYRKIKWDDSTKSLASSQHMKWRKGLRQHLTMELQTSIGFPFSKELPALYVLAGSGLGQHTFSTCSTEVTKQYKSLTCYMLSVLSLRAMNESFLHN